MLKVYKSPKKMKLVIHKRGLKSNTEHDQFIANENKKAKQYIEKEYGGGLGKNKHYLTSSNNKVKQPVK